MDPITISVAVFLCWPTDLVDGVCLKERAFETILAEDVSSDNECFVAGILTVNDRMSAGDLAGKTVGYTISCDLVERAWG